MCSLSVDMMNDSNCICVKGNKFTETKGNKAVYNLLVNHIRMI